MPAYKHSAWIQWPPHLFMVEGQEKLIKWELHKKYSTESYGKLWTSVGSCLVAWLRFLIVGILSNTVLHLKTLMFCELEGGDGTDLLNDTHISNLGDLAPSKFPGWSLLIYMPFWMLDRWSVGKTTRAGFDRSVFLETTLQILTKSAVPNEHHSFDAVVGFMV